MFASVAPVQDDPVTALSATVDRITALDPDGLDDAALADAMVVLRRDQGRLAAVVARLTAAFDSRGTWAEDGSRGAAAWIAARVHQPVEDVRAEVRLGRRLRSMPVTRAALEAGEIAPCHARRLSTLAVGRTATAFPEGEAFLVEQARTARWADFARTCTYWRDVADPDGCEDEAARHHTRRRLHMSAGLDGTGLVIGHLTPTAAATVREALDRIESELYRDDWSAARAQWGDAATASHLARTPAQRRHDALVEMAVRATTAPPDGKRPRPLLNIVVGYETFAGRICELAAGTPVAPGVVADLLGVPDTLIERIVFDGPRRIIEVGHSRLFRGALRRALEIRDRRCTHPTCDVPASRCEADHITPWSHAGPTSLANGQLQCGYHNRWRYEHPDRPAP
jgi:Domain of unknown function (DUF222)